MFHLKAHVMKKVFVFLTLIAFIGIYAVPSSAAVDPVQPDVTVSFDKDQKAKTDKEGKKAKADAKTTTSDCGQKATGCEGKSKAKKSECQGQKGSPGKKMAENKSKESGKEK
jgi:hypothetical protein